MIGLSRPHHAVARRDGPRGAEMERAGLHAPAAHRRRHHQQGAHGGEDRPGLLGPGGARARRLAGGGRRCRSCAARTARPAFDAENRVEQERLRKAHRERAGERPLLTLEEARRRRTPLDWSGYVPPRAVLPRRARRLGVPLGDLVPFIDWSPFFHTWELRGHVSEDLRAPGLGREGARALRRRAAAARRDRGRGGLQAARRLRLLPGGGGGRRHRGLRGRRAPPAARHLPHAAPAERQGRGRARPGLADFVAPRDLGLQDFLGAFAVTTGLAIEKVAGRFEADHDDYSSIMVKALADRLAEALAEWLHQQARERLGLRPRREASPSTS